MAKPRDRFWVNAGKLFFLVAASYAIGASFWCASAGEGFKKRQMARDHRFHESVERLEGLLAKLSATGRRYEDDAAYAQARSEHNAMTAAMEIETENDRTGVEAIRLSSMGGAALSVAYGAFAVGVWFMRSRGSHLAPPA